MRLHFSRPMFALVLFAAGASRIPAGEGTIDLLLNPAATTTISESGSYVLVDNVVMTAATDCINITASDVSLDLNGRTIKGAGGASGSGIVGAGENVVITNGSIANFGNSGIYSQAAEWTVRGVSCRNSQLNGIYLGDFAVVEDCRTTGNGFLQISVKSDGVVRRCEAKGGNGYGLSAAGDHSLFENNRVSGVVPGSESTYGIYMGGNGHRAIGNVVSNITGDGIACLYITGAGCVISGNICRGNAASTSLVGVESTGPGSLIENNIITGNTAGSSVFGISSAGVGARIIGNTSSNNTGGTNGGGYGILSSGARSVVSNNVCADNKASGTNFTGLGIQITGASSLVKENQCAANTGGGTGKAIGIYVNAANVRVEANRCLNHTGSASLNYGIQVQLSGASTVVLNETAGNGTNGILISSGNYRAGNLYTDSVSGGTAGTVPGGADTLH